MSALAKSPYRGLIVLGFLLLTLGVGALALPSIDDMGEVGIIEFELARTSEQASEYYGELGESGRDAAEDSLYLDYPYLILYALFYASACVVVAARAAERGHDPARKLGAAARVGLRGRRGVRCGGEPRPPARARRPHGPAVARARLHVRVGEVPAAHRGDALHRRRVPAHPEGYAGGFTFSNIVERAVEVLALVRGHHARAQQRAAGRDGRVDRDVHVHARRRRARATGARPASRRRSGPGSRASTGSESIVS